MTSLAATINEGPLSLSARPGQDVTGPKEQEPTLGQLVGDAVNSEWVTSHLSRSFLTHLGTFGYRDPGYDPHEEREWERLTDGIDSEYWGELGYAKGSVHGSQIRDNILSRQASRQRLAEAGLTGVALTLGANIVDPLTLAVGAATGGVGAVGTKATRLQRFLKYGAANAAVDVPLEGVRYATDPDATATNVMLSVVGSFTLGGGIGLGVDRLKAAALRDRLNIELEEVVQEAATSPSFRAAMGAAGAEEFQFDPRTLRSQILEQREGLKREGLSYVYRKFIAPLQPKEVQRARVEHIMELQGYDDAMKADVLEVFDNEGLEGVYEALTTPRYTEPVVGRVSDETDAEVALRTPEAVEGEQAVTVVPKRAGDNDVLNASDAPGRFLGIRASMSSSFARSKSAAIRKLGNMLVNDDILRADGQGQGVMATSVWVQAQTSRMGAKFYRAHEAAFRSVKDQFKNVDDFNETVLKAVVDSNFSHIPDPSDTARIAALKQSVKAARDHFSDLGALAQRHGVAGFENFDPNLYYAPRYLDPNKINTLTSRLGVDPTTKKPRIERFVANAFKASYPDMDDEIALRMAKGYLRTARGLNSVDQSQASRIFRPENADILRDVLSEQGELSEAAIDDVLKQITVRDGGVQSGHARARTGGQATEEYFEDIQMPDGSYQRVTFRTDLFDSSVDSIVQRYTHHMVGTSGMVDVYRSWSQALGRAPGTEITTKNQLISEAARQAQEAGESTKYIERLQRNIDLADSVIRGMPTDADNDLNTFFRRLRNAAYSVFGGGFGIAQIPESAMIVARMGARATLQVVPELGNIYRRGVDGKLESPMVALAESFGLGTERLNHRMFTRFDHAAGMADHDVGGLWDTAQRRLNRSIADWSGLAPINMALQRMAGMAAVQRFVNLATDSRVVNAAGEINLSPRMRRMMSSLGLSEDQTKHIIRAIRSEMDAGNITTVEGALGNRVKRFDLDKFSDQVAVADLDRAIISWARGAILQSDLGQMPSVVGKQWGKSLLQFQTFHIAAWERTLLAGISRADYNEFAGWTLASLVGAVVYSAQTHAMANARGDKKQFLKNKLGVESFDEQIGTSKGLLNTLAAGIQRGGWSSLLPQAVDNITQGTGYGPVFNARNTGLNGMLFDPANIPSTAMLWKSVPAAAKGAASVLPGNDAEFTQSDARAIKRMLPGQRLPVFGEFMEAIIAQLPEDER